jgi:spectrin beta
MPPFFLPDIYAYEERVHAVVAVAAELEAEQYHDIARINQRKEHVLALWNQLLELLLGRRHRLELSVAIQRVFHEMLNVLDMASPSPPNVPMPIANWQN